MHRTIFATSPMGIVTLLLCVIPIVHAQTRTLPDIYNPEMITVSGSDLIVVEDATVSIFTLPGLQLRTSFGRKGEGPGEMQVTLFWTNSVTGLADSYLVDGMNKVMYFDQGGKFLQELKKPVGVSQMTRVGSNYVGVKLSCIEDDTQFQTVHLYDSAMEPIKELARQVSPAQSVKMTTELPLDSLHFVVYKDRVFIEKSREGFVIAVFDSTGRQVDTIEKDVRKISIGAREKKSILEQFKEDPSVIQAGWENIMRQTRLLYPDHYPAITDLLIADDRLFVKTAENVPGRDEFMVMDLKGRTLGRILLQGLPRPSLIHQQLGVRYYTLSRGKLYAFVFGDEETRLRIQDYRIEHEETPRK